MEQVVYGLLGRHLTHSYSVPIHRLMGNPDYRLIEAEPEALPALLHNPEIKGLNVTIPYKQAVMPFLDALDPTAMEIGSVNTLVRNADGLLTGYNTDGLGFETMVRRAGIVLKGKKVLLCGSGGASLTVRHVANKAGAREVVVLSRSGDVTYAHLTAHLDAEILINTTPLGMYPDTGPMPIDPELFPQCQGVLDLIYNPSRTALLLKAEALGIPCLGGLTMLVAQARAAESLFFSSPPSPALDADDRICRQLGFDTENIVLIGMPGCGKSTVGALLAELSGRTAVDLDLEIEKASGKTIPALFAEEGEAAFRAMECQQAFRFGREHGLVIITGGGIVKDPQNYRLLKQNGRIYHLTRDLAALATEGRPLSAGGDLSRMYRERLPLYHRFMDKDISNSDRSPMDTAKEIWREYCAYFGIERA